MTHLYTLSSVQAILQEQAQAIKQESTRTWRQPGHSRGFVDYSENGGHTNKHTLHKQTHKGEYRVRFPVS